MKIFKVIKENDEQWSEIIKKSTGFDFYHTICYHELEKDGEPILLVAINGNSFIAFPLIKRQIPNSHFYDCTSAYGYLGPITNVSVENRNSDLEKYFKNNVKKFFLEDNIVACFSRLHPIINNHKLLTDFGKILDINKTISIDLSISAEEQRREYRKSNKYEINKLRKNGYTVVEAKTEEEINTFISIYLETMNKVNAADNYFFDNEYFYKFLNNNCFNSKLLLAKKDNIITAGAIFTITNNIMQYHLAGTRQDYARETPMKLILDEARLLANDLDLKHLHLGGGVGGSDEDSLFKFKSGFSKNTHMFKVWQYIANKEVYDKLVDEKGADKENKYFPLYRS
ncbi:GNAT family N-acetyltransferase [Winogradskyella litorisediminis]|uniref:GNAT family N-acetyltransferase n=1 Tax=Winogradskyella litorisediminis TaxID=1156618 RepID=A0ABW3N7P1_9FLAO